MLEISARRRRYRIDEDGITESDQDGFPLRSIPWDRLRDVRTRELRSTDGTRISLANVGDEHGVFSARVLSEFASRCPEAYAVYRKRVMRRARRTIFVGVPCTLLLPQWAIYVLTGQYNRGLIVLGMTGVGWFVLIYYAFIWRKFDASGMPRTGTSRPVSQKVTKGDA